MNTSLERFLACMEYESSDRRPNYEVGVWPQTVVRWQAEAPEEIAGFGWNWFVGEPALGFDHREYVPVNYGFLPLFESEILEETEDYEILRDHNGVITKALKAGTVGGGRMSMDQHLEHPLKTPSDWPVLRDRLDHGTPGRIPGNLDELKSRWATRDYPLVLGQNCAANGFYWRAREFMGTEALSTAFYDYPEMMHEIMEFFADFIIETSEPVLKQLDGVEYFTLNEDLSMKSGPLLGPKTYREFIFPHLKRMVEFMKGHGVRYFGIDTDGDPTVLIRTFMEAGVDFVWPLERASNVDPVVWRKEFGRDLRMIGGVDKRIVALGGDELKAHLLALMPLVEEGGYIPTLDHTAPPDISWSNWQFYLEKKEALLNGDAASLE